MLSFYSAKEERVPLQALWIYSAYNFPACFCALIFRGIEAAESEQMRQNHN